MPGPETDAVFIDRCERDSLSGRALDADELNRLFRLAGYKGEFPPYRIAYPPLWGMIEDAKRATANGQPGSVADVTPPPKTQQRQR